VDNKKTTQTTLNALPAMPRSGRKNRPTRPCACGCGMGTKGTWYPGHDGRATGWAIRVERGLLGLEEVPANERQGAELMLARRAKEAGRKTA
jgi:hypothetical protein